MPQKRWQNQFVLMQRNVTCLHNQLNLPIQPIAGEPDFTQPTNLITLTNLIHVSQRFHIYIRNKLGNVFKMFLPKTISTIEFEKEFLLDTKASRFWDARFRKFFWCDFLEFVPNINQSALGAGMPGSLRCHTTWAEQKTSVLPICRKQGSDYKWQLTWGSI